MNSGRRDNGGHLWKLSAVGAKQAFGECQSEERERGKRKRDECAGGRPSGCPHAAPHGRRILKQPSSEFPKEKSLAQPGWQWDRLSGTSTYDTDG